MSYLFCFFLALAIECIILVSMFFVSGGMNHTVNAPPSQSEINANYLFFIFHLPTVLPAYILDKILPGPTFMIYTPFTQTIFWTSLFAYINYRRIAKLK